MRGANLMSRKTMFCTLGFCGLPLLLYDLLGMAATSYASLCYRHIYFTTIYFWGLGIMIFIFMFSLFYSGLARERYKTTWICGIFMLMANFRHFFFDNRSMSPYYVGYVFAYIVIGMVVPYTIKKYRERKQSNA